LEPPARLTEVPPADRRVVLPELFLAAAFPGAAFLAGAVFFGAAFLAGADLRALLAADALLRDAAFFAVAFFGAAFFTDAFFGAAFLTAFLAGAAFFTVAFLGAAFLGAAFLGAAFFAAALPVARLPGAFFSGTFAPAERASDKPMAIACLREVTFLPLPVLRVPSLRSWRAAFTLLPARFEYLAMLMCFWMSKCSQRTKFSYQQRGAGGGYEFFVSLPQSKFMPHSDHLTAMLNDLIRINNDRIVGYEKAIDELKEDHEDLRPLFVHYAQQSREYVRELTTEVAGLGGDPTEGTTNSGKVYRVWMDLKATIAGTDRKAILENCEFGEDAAQKAYDTALNSDEELEPSLRDLIVRQKTQLRVSHDEIKRLRDLHKTNS